MKKILQFSFVAMLAIGTAMLFAACEKDDGHSHQDHGGDHGGDRTLSFKKGANRGHMHVLLDGEQTAGQVISTMVRLN